jgi:hypothetical protein
LGSTIRLKTVFGLKTFAPSGMPISGVRANAKGEFRALHFAVDLVAGAKVFDQ